MKVKNIIAGFLSFAMIFQSGVIAVSAEENTSESFVYDDFTINYEIKNSYGNTDVVDVTLTNTGEETIEDWMLYFDPNGEIQYVTHASEMISDNGSVYFKNNGYNADIAPDSAVTFTYAVDDCIEIPDYYVLCQSRIEKTAGYDVSINVTEAWGNSFNGSIVINNNTNEPIEAWELTVDTNFSITEITNSWAATVTELDNYQYKLKGTYTSTIDANSSVSLGFIGVKSSEPEISFYSLTEIKADSDKMVNQLNGNIKLSASTDELLTSEDNLVYFYAKPDYKNVTSMTLIDSETNTVLATMYDDGDFENHGDDLENDGTFSCKINVDNSTETKLSFMANNNNIKSNAYTVTVYKDFSDLDIQEMIAVNNTIQSWLDSSQCMSASIEDRISDVNTLLLNLAENGTVEFPYSLIKPLSIVYDSKYYQYSFTYKSGVEGYLDLKLKNNIDEKVSKTYDNSQTQMSNKNYDIINTLESSNSSSYLGNAHIIYDLNKFNTTHWFDASNYYTLGEDWTSKGLYTTVNAHENINEVNTIDELTNMAGYDYVVIASHGSCSNGTIEILTNVVTSKENIKKYTTDIKSGRVTFYGSKFIATHKLFEHYYQNNELDGTIVYFDACEIFGVDDELCYNMYESLHLAGAETVIGYCNDLYSPYADYMLRDLTDHMLNGYSVGESMEYAKQNNKPKHGEIPVVAGNVDKGLANSNIKNGDFESNDLLPRYWNYSGDVRILSKLGKYTHNTNNFLFMSTGISSKGDFECSQASQVFHVPEGSTTLTLSYNVVSEEPMEWIGDEYDDEFTANIYSGTTCTNVLRESTNTSTWYRTNITNFYGGDNTMYETKWKTVSIDVSQYSGKAIKLEFNMNNIGDDNYDSAVLIDNVKIA